MEIWTLTLVQKKAESLEMFSDTAGGERRAHYNAHRTLRHPSYTIKL